MRNWRIWPSLLLVLCVRVAPSADLPSFEVASVKRSDPKAANSGPNVCKGGPGTLDPTTLRCTNAALSLFILQAYDVKFYEMVAPEWVTHASESSYDVSAKIRPGTTKENYRLMLQRMLSERFHLRVHRETREMPAYVLSLGKKGPKLTPPSMAEPQAPHFTATFIGNHFHWAFHKAALADLAGSLVSQFWSPVLDETGLSGEYDFTLDFAPDENWQTRVGWRPASSVPDETPVLATAISEQLGLKLASRRGPVKVLVVDSADRAPVEN
jgi:uncharacterized protein (TIGR03435 family)